MRKSILEELYYGNICPCTDGSRTDDETTELMSYLAAHHKTLSDGLTEKQKETLGKFDDCQCELTDICERELFIYAFKLGMRFAIETLV